MPPRTPLLAAALIVSACSSSSPPEGSGYDASSEVALSDSGSDASVSSADGGVAMDSAGDSLPALDGGSAAEAGAVPESGAESGMAGEGGPADVLAPEAGLNSQVLAIMSRVAKRGITLYGSAACDWANAAFFPGLIAAYKATGDATFLDAATAWGQKANWLVCTANPNGPTFADNQCCTQTYLELYLLEGGAANPVMIQDAQRVFDSMIANPVAGHTLWNWCDALFMAPPAIARMGAATHDSKYFALLDSEYWDATVQLYSTANGLFWRNPPTTPTDMTFWSRGNGWVIAGTARILEYLPASDPKYAAFVTQLKTMAAALVKLQNPTDGLWRSNLLDPSQYPNPESSGSAFFVYAMAWGITHGVLDAATYLPAVRSGWQGLVNMVDAQGNVGWVQAVGQAPAAATATSTAPYAAGGFLLAGSEVAKVY